MTSWVATLSVRTNTTMRCLRSLRMVPYPWKWLNLFDDVLDSLIIRAERLAQRMLKRNLGDRTWNAGEISSDLRRLNDDVQNYLSVHTVNDIFFFVIILVYAKFSNWRFEHLTSYTRKFPDIFSVSMNADNPPDQTLNIRVCSPTIWKRSWSRSA